MVKKGDLVSLSGKGGTFSIQVTGEMVKHRSLGLVDTARLLDIEWGDAVRISEKEYTLQYPILEDRMGSVRRKAQIVTLKDAAVIVARTGISAGDLVIEAGAGSGVLTIALCHAVAPEGKVVTYEIRDDFAEVAGKNIAAAGYEGISEIKIGDIGEGVQETNAAAMVMDVPEPWRALDHAIKALRPGGVLAVYVPTVNQMERTAQEAREKGFSRIFCTETIEREICVHKGGTRPSFDTLGHTGYILTARRP